MNDSVYLPLHLQYLSSAYLDSPICQRTQSNTAKLRDGQYNIIIII